MDLEEFENDPFFEIAEKSCQVDAGIENIPARFLLGDTPFAAGEVSCIYGKPGATKSVLAIDTACRLAAGMDIEGNVSPRKYGVAYIAAERSDQVKRRVKAFCQHHGLAPFENLVIYNGPIDLAKHSNQLLAIIRACENQTWIHTGRSDGYEIEFVVIDTIAAAMLQPVSNTDATNNAAHNLTRAAKVSGAHVCAIHHPPLGDSSRLSGGHFAGAADLTILVEKKKDGVSVARAIKDNGSDSETAISYRTIGFDLPTANGIENTAVLEFDAPRKLFESSRHKHGKHTIAALSIFRELAASGAVSEVAWLAAMEAADSGVAPQTVRARRDRAKIALLASGEIMPSGNLLILPDKQNSQNSEM